MVTKKVINYMFGLFVAASVMAVAPYAHADTKKDLELLSKALSFINGGPSGDVNVAVVYDPANAESAAHADEVVGILSGGVGSGKVKLTGSKVAASAPGSAPVYFVTKGMGAHYASLLSTAKGNGGITVSNDEACLNGGGCVIVVKSEPSVDILVSTAAAGETGTEFASAFSMMITKK